MKYASLRNRIAALEARHDPDRTLDHDLDWWAKSLERLLQPLEAGLDVLTSPGVDEPLLQVGEITGHGRGDPIRGRLGGDPGKVRRRLLDGGGLGESQIAANLLGRFQVLPLREIYCGLQACGDRESGARSDRGY